MPHTPKDTDVEVPTAELHAGHIGDTIAFPYVMPTSGIRIAVTGELRQIYHTGAGTILSLSSGLDTNGGAIEEFEVIATSVIINPTLPEFPEGFAQ